MSLRAAQVVRLRVFAPFALLTTLALGSAAAAPSPKGARVVWARGSLAYVAPIDSPGFTPGDRVVFSLKRDTIATGSVTRVDPGGLALATLVSGALGDVKHLDRVSVFRESLAVPKPHSLTIGCPSPDRATVLFACGSGPIRPATRPAGYSLASLGAHVHRLVCDSTATPWPDTLTLRAFDDVSDEEIAMERGELDVALFWPGELSAHMREQPRWQGYRLGTRSRGVLVATAVAAGTRAPGVARTPTAADSAALDVLNRVLFRGDLAPWAVGVAPLRPPPRPGSASLPAFIVAPDSGCTRTQPIERFFNRPSDERIPRTGLRLAYADESPATPRDSLGVVRVFTVRCPILCRPELRAYLDRLDPSALADLIGTLTAVREP
jgi:hypothetical protein